MTTIFTRYLYEYSHVQFSLIWALLDCQRDESLFWVYEMYFSGFKEETFRWLWDIYQYMYQELSPNLAPILIHLYRSSEDDDTMIGTWILYLLASPISLTRYMREKNNVYLEYHEMNENVNVLLPYTSVIITTIDVNMYRTVTNKNSEFRNWQILRNVCRFPLRAERIYCENDSTTSSFPSDTEISGTHLTRIETTTYMTSQGKIMHRKRHIPITLDMTKMNSWMYYASFSPLWLERIQEHHGQICHETQKIWFEDEDDEEAFYSDYDLEPDEQPRSVQETILSPPVYRYISWKTFYEIYGSKSNLRKFCIHRDRYGNWSETEGLNN